MKYHPHPSFPGYGWLEPFSDADMPLIEEEFARDIIAAFDALREESDARKALINLLRAEIDALRAKIEQMKQQEPARLVTPTAYRWRYRGAIKWQYGELTEEVARLAKEHNHEVQPLYALPGAQGEEK